MKQGLAQYRAHVGESTNPLLALMPFPLVLLLLAASCDTPRATTPWPRTEAEARALVDSRTVHAQASTPLDAPTLIAALDAATEDAALTLGWGAISDVLAQHRIVLFGVHHDARGQHEAFRRLFGPLGSPRTMALELFDADGSWSGIDQQEGDDAALARYTERGDGLDDLRGRLARGAYTAWKYDLMDEALSSVVAARAGGRRVLGCDVPPALARALAHWDERVRLRMRELHCALAIERHDRPVAVLIGAAHVESEGLPRFLDAASVHTVGGRSSPAGLEAELDVRVADPVLFPLGDASYVLLLPGPHLGLPVHRSRERETAPGVRVDVPDDVRVHTGPGWVALAREQRRWVVGLPLDDGDGAQLTLDEPMESAEVRFYASRREPPGSTR